jgi:plastocyanin domain-containing protein
MASMRTMVSLLATFVLIACRGGDPSSGPAPAASAAPVVTTAATPAPATSASGATTGGTTIAVKVDGDGFTPSSASFKKGEHAQLVFTRTSDKTCAKEVVFPELNVKKPLPLNEAVAIDVPTADARKLTFQCGMGMYKSTVTIQ